MPQGAIPFPFGDCRICCDRATGVHYGVATCEGCKGFYKRSLPKADKYKCFFGGQCQLSPQNRNRCKACRFKKCMDAGMSVDAVKMGRIPKVDKERALEEKKFPTGGGGISPMGGNYTPPGGDPAGFVYGRQGEEARSAGQSQLNNQPKPYMDLLDSDAAVAGGSGSYPPPSLPPSTAYPLPPASNLLSNNGYKNHGSNGDSGFSDSNHSDPDSPRKLEHTTHQQAAFSQSELTLHKVLKPDPDGPYHPPGYPHTAALPTLPHSSAAETSFNLPPMSNFHQHSSIGNQSRPGFSQTGLPHGGKPSLPLLTMPPGPPGHPPTEAAHYLPTHSPQRARHGSGEQALGSPSSEGRGLYSPGVMKELLHKVMQSGSGSTPVREPAAGGFPAQTVAGVFPTPPAAGGFPAPPATGGFPTSPAAGFPEQTQLLQNLRSMVDLSPTQHSPGGMISPTKRKYSESDSPRLENTINQQLWGTISSAEEDSIADVVNPKVPALDCNRILGQSSQLDRALKKEIEPFLEQFARTSGLNPAFQEHVMNQLIRRDGKSSSVASPMGGRSSIGSMVSEMDDVNMRTPPSNVSSLNYQFMTEAKIKQEVIDDEDNTSCRSMSRTTEHLLPFTVQMPSPLTENVLSPVLSPTDSRHSSDSDMKTPSPLVHIAQVRNHLLGSPEGEGGGGRDGWGEEGGGPGTRGRPRQEELIIIKEEIDDGIRPYTAEQKSMDLNMVLSTLNKISESEQRNCGQIREHLRMMRAELKGKRPVHPMNRLKQATYDQVKVMWRALFDGIQPTNKIVISVCQELPGFAKLEQIDQACMLEESYFDIWLILHAELFTGGESYVRCINDVAYSHFWMSHFLTESLINHMMRFAEELNSCGLSRVEINVLCAIQLTNPERPNIEPKEEIQLLHSHYLDVLAYSIQRSRPLNHSRLLINIFRILPMLQIIQVEQAEVIGSFRCDSPPARCHSMIVPGSKEREQERERQEKEQQIWKETEPSPTSTSIATPVNSHPTPVASPPSPLTSPPTPEVGTAPLSV